MILNIPIILNDDFPKLIEEIRLYRNSAKYDWVRYFQYNGLYFEIKQDIWSDLQSEFIIVLKGGSRYSEMFSHSEMFPPDMNLSDPLTQESLIRNLKTIFNRLILVSVHSE